MLYWKSCKTYVANTQNNCSITFWRVFELVVETIQTWKTITSEKSLSFSGKANISSSTSFLSKYNMNAPNPFPANFHLQVLFWCFITLHVVGCHKSITFKEDLHDQLLFSKCFLSSIIPIASIETRWFVWEACCWLVGFSKCCKSMFVVVVQERHVIAVLNAASLMKVLRWTIFSL